MEDALKKEGAEEKAYELAFLVRDEEAARDLRRIAGQHDVKIQSEAPLKKINLAYKIKRAHEAYFGFVQFLSGPEAAQALSRDLRANQGVVRFIVVALPRRKSALAEPLVRPERPVPWRAPLPRETRQSKPLSNEALEKKIEEISQ